MHEHLNLPTVLLLFLNHNLYFTEAKVNHKST
jgi:hypothetical protein